LTGREDLGHQTQQVFKNIEMALVSAGATFDDVFKMTIHVANYKPEYRSAILEARSQFITSENPPTSVWLGVQFLAIEEFLIEIYAIAVVD
jgi:enamine deaminase RidA (YjgF/YER057c/UK114 family)